MTKDFDELKKDMIQSYVDSYSPDDTNKQVETWLKDTAPDFDFTVNNSAMNKGLNFDDVINNESELDDKKFTYDGTKWTLQ